MTILQDVERFVLRLAPQPVCDVCIGDRLALEKHIVSRKSRQLAGSKGFERKSAACSLCDSVTLVIRHR